MPALALRLHILVLLCVVNGACLCNKTPPPDAPTDLQENVHWMWTNSDDADDTQMNTGIAKLAVAAQADSWTKAVEGQSTVHLVNADVTDFVTDMSTDPSTAHPLLVVNEFKCTQAQLEKVLLNDDQNTEFPGTYDKYIRTDNYDRSAFDAKTLDFAKWTNAVNITFPVSDSYTSTVNGSLRRIKKAEATFAQSDTLIARTYLPAPATFGGASSSWYRQDYEIEIFWEQKSGTMFHVYGMWRDVKIGGFGLTLDDDGFKNLVLDNLVKWDQKMEQLCSML